VAKLKLGPILGDKPVKLTVESPADLRRDLFAYARLRPPAMARVHILPVTEALRQIAPRDASAVAIDHRLHEQAVLRRVHADMTVSPRKLVADTKPLIVQKAVASHPSAP